MMRSGRGRAALLDEVRELREQLASLTEGELATRVHLIGPLIDAIPTPIFYKNTRGAFVGCNNAFARDVMGLPCEKIIGRTVFELAEAIPTDLAQMYQRQDVALINTRGTQIYEAPAKYADGSRRRVLFSKAALPDPSGGVAGLVGVMVDLTPYGQSESRHEADLLDAQRRATRLQAAAEISRAASSILSLDELLHRSVNLILDRFGLYYAGIFLLDEQSEWAVLRAGTGEAGAEMLASGHRLLCGGDSMIGQCVADAEPCISLDVDETETRFDNPLLPETRSEMALPLISRNRVIGAMTIQSVEVGAFAQEDITVLQTMADQLANAIQNARLFDRMDRAVRENETLYNVSTAIGVARSIDDVLQASVDVAAFLAMDGAALWTFTRQDAEGVPIAADARTVTLRQGGMGAEFWEAQDVPVDRTLYEWLFADPRRIHAYADLEGPAIDGSVAPPPDVVVDQMAREGKRSLIAAALISREREQGVLMLYGPEPLRTLPDHHVQVFARSLVDQVASVLDRQILAAEVEQHASQLAAAAEVSRALSAYLDLEALLSAATSLIHDRFNLAYVGVYVVGAAREGAAADLELRAESGDAAARWNPSDVSAWMTECIRDRRPMRWTPPNRALIESEPPSPMEEERGSGNVRQERTVATLPLISHDEAIGAVVIEGAVPSALDEDAVAIYTTLADHLANAIVNARLFASSQTSLEELRRLQQQYAVKMWGDYVARQDVTGYVFDSDRVLPLGRARHGPEEGGGGRQPAFERPLQIRGETVGLMSFAAEEGPATWSEDQVAVLDAVREQLELALENRLLMERSQRSLSETRALYRIAQHITDAHDPVAVLRAAVEGMAARLSDEAAGEWDGVIGALLEPRADPTRLRVVAAREHPDRALPVDSLDLGEVNWLCEAMEGEERFVTPDVRNPPNLTATTLSVASVAAGLGFFDDLGVRGMAAFPLRVRGARYGLLLVHAPDVREFTADELSFYENVARQASVALDNLSLVDVTRAQAERRDVLNEVLRIASGSLDQATILTDVGEVLARRLGRVVLTWEHDRMTTRAVSAHDVDGREIPFERVDGRGPMASLCYDVIERGRPARADRRDADGVEAFAVPLSARDVIYGAVLLGRREGQAPLDDQECELMRVVGTSVGTALETATLYRDAQETAEKLKEVDELKNQFMANMSHELRTPLNSIIGFSRVMIKGIDGPLTEMQETDLNAIHDSGRHLLDLINDILDISKINAGKMEIIFEPVDLRAMVKSVMSTALGFVKDKPIELLTDVPDDLPLIVADSRRIRQVLTNLLGNAGKFTDEGFIKVSATHDDYQVIVSVQDTGIGIPTDRVHAVFEQFEQVDSSSTRRYGGTGLGIPLSREFVRIHGGDMWIQETEVGRGTTFSFALPIGGPDDVPAENGLGNGSLGAERFGAPLRRDRQASGVVLTVDDDAGVVTLFRRYLETQGYHVFGLTNGARVVEEAKRLKPCAITLDVILPNEDGWSILEELKADPETRDIPVIVCSILGDEERGLSMGVSDYLVKPISEQDLLGSLARLDGDLHRGYVLVVDDNAGDRQLLRRILENAAYEVVEADGGAGAIERIHKSLPAAVVLDLMMPNVDGFEVLEHLKTDPATRQVPVVVVTAKDLSVDERSFLQQRTVALLQKGLFSQQQLLADVASALDHAEQVLAT